MWNLENLIQTHPMKELHFSWEQKIRGRVSEKDWLVPYKAIMYLPGNTHGPMEKENLDDEATAYLEELDFQFEMDLRGEEIKIEEILCEKDDDCVEDIASMLSDLSLKRKRKEDLTILCDVEDLCVEPSPKRIFVEETFNSEQRWSPQEICERIRLLQVCGKIKISTEDMNKITQEFGESRVMKERPLHAHGSAPSDTEKADRSDPLPSMNVFELMEENERLKKNYRLALEEIDIITYHYQV